MRVEAERRGIDLSRSFAYSDSATDIPMLEVVGNAVAVNPDRELLRAAREHEWEVRSFTHPVRLRDRLPLPPAGPTAAVGGGLAIAAAAAAVWWWLRREATAEAAPVAPVPQTVRTFLAATKARAARMASSRSFFMSHDRTGRGRRDLRARSRG